MIKGTAKQRLYLMDDVKLLASYFVIFIHCMFPGDFGIAVKAIARFAVPFFFMCSGFFLYGNTSKGIINKAFHILKLFLITVLIYLCVDIGVFVIRWDLDGLSEYISCLISLREFAKLVLFNVSPGSVHLWYLPAMVYVYIICYFFDKLKVPDSVAAISAVVLLLLHLLIWHIFVSFEITDSTFYVRNFLFIGYPFVSIGRLMKKHQDKLPRLKWITVTLLLTAGSICSILSRIAFGNKSLPFGAIVISVTLMTVCITAKKSQKPTVANAGACSTYIYLLHPLVIEGYFWMISSIGMENALFVGLAPVFVCIATTGVAVICLIVQRKLSSFLKNYSK